MKWIKLFEGFTNEAKLFKANYIFGVWLMTGIIARTKKELKEEVTSSVGESIHYFSSDSGKNVVKYTKTMETKPEYKVDICFMYSMKLIGYFGREIGLGSRADRFTEDTANFIMYFYKAFILVYGLPSYAKLATTTGSIL
jgi:hypothetical protein